MPDVGGSREVCESAFTSGACDLDVGFHVMVNIITKIIIKNIQCLDYMILDDSAQLFILLI